MARRLKLLTGISTMAASGALALSACGGEGEGSEGSESGEAGAVLSAPGSESEGSESEGEGESEGESGGATAPDDRVAYLSKLLIVQGHLQTGAALYETGDRAMAATHMKHPEDEIYADILPMFAAFGAAGFSDELSTLANGAAEGAPSDIVFGHLGAVKTAIVEASAAAQPTTKDYLLAAAKTLATAGEEFDIGVKDGAIVNVHEYQDAYGFMTATLEMIRRLKGETQIERNAIALALWETQEALKAAPSARPPERVDATSETIFGAAAKIEIAALGLQ